MHMCISYIFHCILMVFRQRVKYFLTLSNAAQSCETLGHSFFFMELTPPLAQPPLSYHYRQQPLSPTTVATTASTPPHEILIFTSSTLNFWGKSLTKASFSNLPFSFWGKSRKKASFTPSPVSSNNSFRKHLSPAMSSACLLLIWTSKVRQEKLFFSERCASVWPTGIFWIFGYRFVIVSVIVWDPWLDQENLPNNECGKLFWKFVLYM